MKVFVMLPARKWSARLMPMPDWAYAVVPRA